MEAVEQAVSHKIITSLLPLAVPIDEPQLLKGNPRVGNIDAVAKSLDKFGQRKPIVCRRDTKEVVAGNHTLQGARRLGWTEIAAVWTDDDDATAKAFALADNRTSELGTYDDDALAAMIADVLEADESLLEAASYDLDDLEALLDQTSGPVDLDEPDDEEGPKGDNPLAGVKKQEAPATRHATLSLFDRFMVPPFSILNAREGWWQDRKNTWIGLGLEGELGRDDKPRTWYLAAPQHHHHPDRPFVPYGAADEKKREDDDE